MYFAGPICDGIECAPLVIVILVTTLIPIVIGIGLAWLISGYAIKLLNNRRKRQITGRQSFVVRIVAVTILAILAFGIFIFLKSSWYEGFVFRKGTEQTGKFTIYQPILIEPEEVVVFVDKSGLFANTTFQAMSKFKIGDGQLLIEEHKSGRLAYNASDNINKTCKKYDEIDYCYIDDARYQKIEDLGRFYVYHYGTDLILDFDKLADPINELERLLSDGLVKKEIQNIGNVRYTDDFLELH